MVAEGPSARGTLDLESPVRVEEGVVTTTISCMTTHVPPLVHPLRACRSLECIVERVHQVKTNAHGLAENLGQVQESTHGPSAAIRWPLCGQNTHHDHKYGAGDLGYVVEQHRLDAGNAFAFSHNLVGRGRFLLVED